MNCRLWFLQETYPLFAYVMVWYNTSLKIPLITHHFLLIRKYYIKTHKRLPDFCRNKDVTVLKQNFRVGLSHIWGDTRAQQVADKPADTTVGLKLIQMKNLILVFESFHYSKYNFNVIRLYQNYIIKYSINKLNKYTVMKYLK